MSTVVDAARPVGASPPPVRHGICRLTLRIGGMDYRLRPMPAPPGFRAVWVLRKLEPAGEVTYSVAAPKGEAAGCTCPDHEHNGATCKHIMALATLGLIPAPKPPRARTVSPARARRLHAKNARQAIAEAKALPVEARRHLAEIASPAEDFAAGFRAAVRDELARISGNPAQPRPALCELCGEPFDPAVFRDPRYCTECLEAGAL